MTGIHYRDNVFTVNTFKKYLAAALKPKTAKLQ